VGYPPADVGGHRDLADHRRHPLRPDALTKLRHGAVLRAIEARKAGEEWESEGLRALL